MPVTPGYTAHEMLGALQSRYVDTESIPWTEARHGSRMKVLYKDNETREALIMIETDPGCVLTDHEHTEGGPDKALVDLTRGADLVIYDSTYTDEEYPNHVGWGHSTWREGVKLCEIAEAKKFVVFHHDPGHDDTFMDRIARDVTDARPGSVVAREGLVLRP